uniref:Uncharacterized protein n=1 Tax=Oryza barthii TaxID=65489 RepID=A0A0D3FQ22_9ORYZ
MTWPADMWGPRGSHADSAATSDKTGLKTTEGSREALAGAWSLQHKCTAGERERACAAARAHLPLLLLHDRDQRRLQ